MRCTSSQDFLQKYKILLNGILKVKIVILEYKIFWMQCAIKIKIENVFVIENIFRKMTLVINSNLSDPLSYNDPDYERGCELFLKSCNDTRILFKEGEDVTSVISSSSFISQTCGRTKPDFSSFLAFS